MLTSLLRVQTRTFSAARPAFAKKVKDGVPKKPLKPLDKSIQNPNPSSSTHPIISKTISTTAAVGDKKETPEITPKDAAKAEAEASKQTAEAEAKKKAEAEAKGIVSLESV